MCSAGIGRYGQDLHKTATTALKQTVALKKKTVSRTTKTVRQLRNAKDHSFEAAQKAISATRAAEQAVHRLAQFAGLLCTSALHAQSALFDSLAIVLYCCVLVVHTISGLLIQCCLFFSCCDVMVKALLMTPWMSCAGTFDGLVKDAVHTANAAAQLRADYAASVVAGDLAEAQRDRVIGKKGKRQSSSPKSPKKLSWAANEHLVQERVYSTVCN